MTRASTLGRTAVGACVSFAQSGWEEERVWWLMGLADWLKGAGAGRPGPAGDGRCCGLGSGVGDRLQ